MHKATEVDDTDGKKVAIRLIMDAPARLERHKKARKEIAFFLSLKKSENVVTILNWEVKESSVAIVKEYCTLRLDGNGELHSSKRDFTVCSVQT